ncbi:MAG TPA: tRNA uracil 4-sulfurtransferase ThiI [Patescibacteria group bacterium]
MKFDHILIHYGEIALKGKNRAFFEVQLIANIKSQLEAFAPGSFEDVKKAYGSIIVKLTEKGIQEKEQVTKALGHTFGIVNFSFAASLSHDIEEIKQACWEMLKSGDFQSFRITSTRSNKQFPLTSEQLNREIGEFIFENFQRTKKVDLKNPEVQCFIHILNKIALVSSKKLKGPGGLPVGTGSKAMVLMSGGFDSPIAAWQVLKRGVSLRYAHFHSIPYTSRESLEKVQDLVKVLKTYGTSGKIYSIPFADVQKHIMMNCPQSLRVILYRRFMMRIAEALARKEKCLALVTGDSIGQVASQTLENIFAVSEAATMPIFRPLIGEDKEEIMQKAREIGTYDISKLPHDDCCTRLMPKNPETRARLADVLEAEKNLDIEKLVQETLAKTERIDVE